MVVTHPNTGTYCISGLPFEPRSAVATTQFDDTSINVVLKSIGFFLGCNATTQVSIDEALTSGTSEDRDAPFMIVFN